MTAQSNHRQDDYAVGDRVRVKGLGEGVIARPAHRDSPWTWVVESEARTFVWPRWTMAVRSEEINRA